MEHRRVDIPIATPVKSLCWAGDLLVDWAGGNRFIRLDGHDSGSSAQWGNHFDAAVQSPSGRYAAIYERLGTKAVLLDGGAVLRELGRDGDHSDAYEYPIVFLTHPNGRELVAHCPQRSDRIEIDDVATGARLTNGVERSPEDFFHSRLAVSADGRRLLSVGWVWHPFDSACTWLLEDVLADARSLDKVTPPDRVVRVEINDASFIDSDRILISSNSDALNPCHSKPPEFFTGHLGVFDLTTNSLVSCAKTEETVGRMLWLGDGRVLGLYDTPKLFDLATGSVLHRWPDISTGKQASSIISHLGPLPAITIDEKRRRVAVASPDRIATLQF